MLVALLSLAAAVFVATSGNWRIEKTKDSMTDKVSCIASFRGRGDLMLTETVLYISTKVAPARLMIRLGDESAQERLSFPSEKSSRSIMLGTFDLDQILERKIPRVRYRVFTVLDTVVEGEVDLRGLDHALAILRSEKCAG